MLRTAPRCPHPMSLAMFLLSFGCAPAASNVLVPTTHAQPPLPVFEFVEDGNMPREERANVVSSHITAVTVYSDRALVTREANVQLTAGDVVYRLSGLPGWVDDGSIRVTTSAGKIIDVSAVRRFLARPTDSTFRKAELRHRELLSRVQALDDELAILDAQKSHVESIKASSTDKLRDMRISGYGEVIHFVSDSLRETAAARRKIQAERELRKPDVDASARNLEELRQLTTLETTTVLVTLQGTSATAAKLALTYATPGATWEPMHELRAESANPTEAELRSYAVVTQTTGEDWGGAELSFSTQSAADPDHIPKLEMLALGKTEETTRTMTRRETSFNRAQQAYAKQNRNWNSLNQAQSKVRTEIEQFEKSYSMNLEYFERVQNRTVEIFQGLQQRGTNAHFAAAAPSVVRSDGRPVRVPIGSDRVKTMGKIVAAPEESANAAVTLRMTNDSPRALLPGSVARFRDGAFLGMTDVDFVAQGEDFSVFFSVADQVKLTRKLDRKHSSLSRSARNHMQLSFVTTAKNLSTKPVDLVLAERLPVSESSEIRVTNVEIKPASKPDVEGIVRWSVTLKPGEELSFHTGYQIDYPPALILDVRRRKDASPPTHRAGQPSPSAPHPKKYELEDHIRDMERRL